MKKFLLFIVAIVGYFMTMAESKVYVVKTDGTEVVFLLSEIDSIRFEEDTTTNPIPEQETIVDADSSIFDLRLNATKDGLVVYGLKNRDTEGAVSIPAKAMYRGKIYDVTEIGVFALASCDSITSVVIPNTIKKIGGCAFENSPNLTNVVIPNSVTEIGTLAFSKCEGLTEVEIPKSVTKIDDYAFWKCTNLKTLRIPESCEIGEDIAPENTEIIRY